MIKKSKVDLYEIEKHYKSTNNYEKTAKWASDKYNIPILGPHIRYWLNTPNPTEQKILIFDIETSPMEVYTWGLYNQDIGINQIKTDWKILMWAAKWFNEDRIFFKKAIYGKSEKKCLLELWKLLEEADIVVAHNAINFDVKKINAKFMEYGIKQPSYYKIIDTLKVARNKFGFTSNKLDYISKLLGKDGKNNTNFDLWLGCMRNDKTSWQTMIDYCIQDVLILQSVYEELRSWDNRHPKIYFDESSLCNICGSKELEYVKDFNTAASTFEIYRCKDCNHQQRSRINVANKKEKIHRQVSM